MSDLILNLAAIIQREVDVVSGAAQNTANANTVGYKSLRTFSTLSGVDTAAGTAPATVIANHVTATDGMLKFTGRDTDLALSGNAWFVVKTPDGLRLTRDGRFHRAADGILVNASGWSVMGPQGAIQLGDRAITVAKDGQISAGDSTINRLLLVSVDNQAAVKLDKAGLYVTKAPLGEPGQYAVHQGMLEQSNVELGADMVRMMEASRHIESVQRALSAYDNVLSSGINQIGKD